MRRQAGLVTDLDNQNRYFAVLNVSDIRQEFPLNQSDSKNDWEPKTSVHMVSIYSKEQEGDATLTAEC